MPRFRARILTSVVAAKLGGGSVVVGLGRGETYLASDIPALLPYTRNVVMLEDGEVARITRDGAELITLDGRRVERAPSRIDWDPAMAQKGGYRHFMLKEIYEQPRAVADTLLGRLLVDGAAVSLPEAHLDAGLANRLERVVIVACGTSYHAALVGRFMVERLAGLSAEVDIASEFRYRDLVLDHRTLVVAISQSGETVDTLGAVKAARARQAPVLGITNVVGSAIAREANGVVYTHAGPEIGVASTKTFTATIAACYLVALCLGERRGYLSDADARKRAEEILEAPRFMEEALAVDQSVAALAHDLARYPNFLFLGRGLHFPLALEGALKLKEISYIHAEGYAAGEMKHGPIALIDEKMPVVALVPRDATYERMMGNLQEVRARDGRVIAICHPRGSRGEPDRQRHHHRPGRARPHRPSGLGSAAPALCLPCSGLSRPGRGPAPQSRQERDRGMMPGVETGPLVSAVVTLYNQGHFARVTIESVLAQDYRPMEVIVVDDGSTDDTPEVCAAFGARLPSRVADGASRLLGQSSGGRASTRDLGGER